MATGGITEGILLIASIIVAAGLSAVVIGKAGAINSAFTVATEAQKEITLTKIKIIYATGNTSSSAIQVWVKNIGTTPINNIDDVDVYFGPIGSISKIPYNAGSNPTWAYSTGFTQWQVKDTVQINITYSSNLASGTTYLVRLSTPNGITDEYVLST